MVSVEGLGDNPVTGLPPLHPVIDRGPSIGASRVLLPSYEETFATGVAVARAKLRRLPATLEIVDSTRLSDYEPSSLKRLAAMTAWAEEYPGVTLQDGELLLLNGTTVGRLVTYMQLKRTNVEIRNDKELKKDTTQEEVELTKEELDVLNSRVPTPPELPVSPDPTQPLPDEVLAENKIALNRHNDVSADLLLEAMIAKVALPAT